MTQTVFDNAMVAHVWAQRQQAEARSHNGNFSFSGDVLYSYTTPIARFIDVPGKGYAVLVTSRSYSTTTSGKHMPALRRALSSGGYQREFRVPDVNPVSRADHETNLAHLLSRYEETAYKALRARDDWRLSGLDDDLAEVAERVERYADMFDLKAPKLKPMDRASEVRMERAKRLAKANTPAAIAKREAARVQREAREARKLELARANAAERLAAWRKGEPVTLGWGEGRDEAGGALLRVRGQFLETSMGAKVPLADAVRVFKFVKLCRANQVAWQRNGSSLPVGHFQVDWISNTGSFRAGCHLIHWNEIALAAEAAGVLFEEAGDTTVKVAA